MKPEHDPLKVTFTNKAEYLAWRAAWREHYALLSAGIRSTKHDRKHEDPQKRAAAQYCCCLRRKEATELLRVRKESKLEAQRQYLAAKALPVTAT